MNDAPTPPGAEQTGAANSDSGSGWPWALDNMSRVELLTAEDSFLFEGRGVVVIPFFPVPEGWKDRTEKVEVTMPGGQQYEATAQFIMTHFLLSASAGRGMWRVVVSLLNKKKEDLPAGSKILVSPEIRDAILPPNGA